VNASVATVVNSWVNDTLSNVSNAQKVKSYQRKFPQDHIPVCRGILANQDLEEVDIQKGLFYVTKYYQVPNKSKQRGSPENRRHQLLFFLCGKQFK
jgi:hypothetical protein